jgi:hypothetical protein
VCLPNHGPASHLTIVLIIGFGMVFKVVVSLQFSIEVAYRFVFLLVI